MTTTSPHRSCRTIGLWCNYHETLVPTEGIGVFVHNLARGIANLPDGPAVALCIRPGDEALVAETVRQGNDKIRTLSLQRPSRLTRKYRRLVRRWWNRCDRLHRALTDSAARNSLRAGKENSLDFAARGFAILMQGFLLVVRCALNWLASRQEEIDRCITAKHEELIDQCDVWLVPYFGLDVEFSKATVLVIHDLVFFHYPETLPADELLRASELAHRTAERSTVVACMSEFIRQNDLEGVLQLPKSKTRVLQPATPRDFGLPLAELPAEHAFPVLNSEFLFYPAAFRPYKNHRLLVDALALRHAAGDKSLQLVFTGIQDPPQALLKQIRALGLDQDVHILGKLDRTSLTEFYRKAQATIVPSKYEQGSFPIMEAIHCGCPVACSRIAPLMELFAPMGSTMRYFDPERAEELSQVIADLRSRRAEVLAAQQAASRQMFERTWTDAATDWLALCEEAIDLKNQADMKGDKLREERTVKARHAA